MSLTSYKNLINDRFNFLKANEMPLRIAKELDQLLVLPHPNREIQFVLWSTRSILESGYLDKIKLNKADLN